MERKFFGETPDGRRVDLIVLDSGPARCGVLTYGGTLQFLEVPDRAGQPTDVALGFDGLEGYLGQDKFIGALVGRYANRIGGSTFTLEGVRYRLRANEGENHIHGGGEGFDKKLWEAREIPQGVRLSLTSPHMEEGYPGRLEVSVSYLLHGTTLTIRFEAASDRDTVCNLTSHAYFNLKGQGRGKVTDHELKLFASNYTPVADSASIPTGELAPVEGTPMDFRAPRLIGERIDQDFPQLRFGSGYDHNWAVDGSTGILRPAAQAYSAESGIAMEVDTTLPGIQFYAGNFLEGCPAGKGGAVYGNREGFCLETQFYPDSPNRPGFPQPLLRAGEKYDHTTVFRFSVK